MYQEFSYLFTNCIELASYKVVLVDVKTASTNFTWLYFKTFDSFIFHIPALQFEYFVLSSFVW